jgi:peptidoglycan/LPS O-acetylase OafA/YrhL
MVAFCEPLGGIAVMLFFILSGFVIGLSTSIKPTAEQLRIYLLKRLIRLFPIYLIALVISFAVAGESVFSTDFLFHLVFLQGAVVPVISSNGPLWSLHFEAAYYLLFVIVWIAPSWLSIFAGFSVVAGIISIWVTSDALNVLALFGYWLFGLGLSRQSRFLTGCLDHSGTTSLWWPLFLFWAYQTSGAMGGMVKRAGGSNSWGFTLVVGLPLVADVFLSVLKKRLRPVVSLPFYIAIVCIIAIGYGYGLISGKFREMAGYTVSAGFLAIGITAVVLRIPAPSISRWRSLSWAGAISYALYVVHHPLLDLSRKLSGGHTGMTVSLVAFVIISFGAAFMLEMRLQRWLAPFLRRFCRLDPPLPVRMYEPT